MAGINQPSNVVVLSSAHVTLDKVAVLPIGHVEDCFIAAMKIVALNFYGMRHIAAKVILKC